MRILLFFVLGIHVASAAIHTLQYYYTATSGIANFPEFVSLGMVDGQQTDYYDSKIKRAIPKTEWMSAREGPEYWEQQTQQCLGDEQNFKVNIDIAKSRFNQSGGVHVIQRMYGCQWDEENKETSGFFKDAVDGEDFLSLDLKEMRWISPVQQGGITTQKWNNDRAMLEVYKQYFTTECTKWLKTYLQYGSNSLQKTVSPQVSLLQKHSASPVACHATGFYPIGVKISWQKNGQDYDEDVDLGEILINEDGTFQRASTLRVNPDEWKNNEFSCVVEHQGKTIKTILVDYEIRTNNENSVPIGIIIGVVAAVLLVVIGITVYVVYKKKGKSGFVPANTSDGGSNNSSQGAAA